MGDYATIVAARQALERLEAVRESVGWADDMTYDELVVTLDAVARDDA